MTPSKAFHIRLNPSDILGCIDVVEVSGLEVPNMSLSQVVRGALMVLLASARKAGAIPAEDEGGGFDYAKRVGKYRIPKLGARVQAGQIITTADMLRAGADQSAVFSQRALPVPDAPLGEEEIRASQERTVALLEADDPRAAARLRRELGLPSKRGGALDPTVRNATAPRGTTRATRMDPRLHRYNELKFRSEQDPLNVSKEEFKELRALGAALGRP